MNPRELLARLNVPAVRYEIGRGGIPELTNIDIAGALGMIEDKFARDVFMVAWWEDSAKSQEPSVAQEALRRIMEERNRRERMLLIARLELNIAETGIAAKRRPTEFDTRILQTCKREVEQATANTWPWKLRRDPREKNAGPDAPTVYSRMYRACMSEIRSPRHCYLCRGRGEVLVGALKTICEGCKGTGIKSQMKKDRSVSLGVDEQQYCRLWFRVYEWAFEMIRSAETGGAIAFSRAVARAEHDAA